MSSNLRSDAHLSDKLETLASSVYHQYKSLETHLRRLDNASDGKLALKILNRLKNDLNLFQTIEGTPHNEPI